jgi:hypothetical protein
VFDPETVFDDYPRAIRPIVTKFDEGQGPLCEGYNVYDVGVTSDNKKWIATNNGVYFVSADGTEVYNHFTTANSDIPSDLVYSVECDTIHNRVYIYTDNGFAEYIVNGDAAALNYDATYAFPNPVRPGYDGPIAIKGFTRDALVHVTDGRGHVVYATTAQGGQAIWNGRNSHGDRVASGTYYVFASDKAGKMRSVAKILIIR